MEKLPLSLHRISFKNDILKEKEKGTVMNRNQWNKNGVTYAENTLKDLLGPSFLRQSVMMNRTLGAAALVSSQDHLSLFPTLCGKARLWMLTVVRVKSFQHNLHLL